MEDLFQVGVITAPHGVRGEVKVFPTTDDNARFKNLKTVLLDQGRGTRELEIEGVKFFKNMVILKFKGIDLSLIHISEPTRPAYRSRMPSSA